MISGYEQEANFANPVNENLTIYLTIYAEYTAETYHVTYVFNDGSREDFEYSVDYHYGDRIDYVESFETEETAYKGHTLVGWFKDEELTDQWNFETDTITGNLTLYAKWELNDQTVTYTSYNGMDNDPVEGVTRTYKYGDVIYLDYNDGTALSELEIDGDKMLSDQTRDGYTFMGWYVEDDGCTFTAQWKEITYTVTFDPNGGSFEEGVSSTLEVAYSDGQITEEETPVPSMDGYTFAGWYTGPADDAAIYDYSTSISDSFTLYAHWTQTTYTVTYIGNGGEATIDGLDGYTEYTQTIYDTKGQSFILNLFEREGYTFIGWTLKEDGSGSLFADEKAISNPRNMTLYAQWDANEYTVVFDANGGNIVGGGAAETTVLDFGETLNIPTPEKDGYTFTGWFYTDETTLSVYEAGTEVEYKEPYNLTLLAGWAPNSYYITFDAGEGVIKDSNGENSVQYHITYDGSYTVPVAERTGYEFKGWYDDDENLVYEGGETTTLTIAEDCTLTAGWEQERYSVTFVSDDVSRTRANAYTYGQTIPEPFSFSKDGYTLEGWYTQPDGGGDKWDFATSTIISDLTLYANWEPIVYTVSYDAWAGDGNEPTDGEQKFYYNEVITIDPNGGIYDGSAEVAIQADYTLDEPTRNNYTFTGWYFDSSSYTFTAQWTEITYIVTFIGNGGEATIEGVPGYTEYTQTLYADQTGQKLIANLFEREGYTFTGWSTKQEGGTLWSDGRTISSPRNLTLYAQWEVSEYTVTFHGNGGYTSYNSTTYTETVTHGYVLSLPAYDLFTRQGYVFLGWSDEPNTEIDYEVGTATIPVSGETHLYAVWAQVVDFGNITYGTPGTEIEIRDVQYGNIISDISGATNFRAQRDEDNDWAELSINPKINLTPGSYTELITVTLENGETHYIQAMVNVTLGDITVGIVDPKDFYVVDDEITVYVEAAPNQSLTLEVTGNTGGALEEIMGLTEDAENPGHYYATYKVTSIPENELSLTFNVWLGENVVATNTEAVALRTVLYVTMTESDGGAIGPDSLAITLKDANDTSRSQTFSYDTEGGRYYTFVDKSGWDYIQIDANDGRSLTLWYTTMIPEQMLADALLGDYGIVNASYQFAGYTVEATLSINGEPVDNVSYTLTGNYGADINFNALIVWAADQASYLYGNPQTDRYNTTITNMAGETLTSGKYGEENSLMTWGENNTLQVNIDITVEYKVAFMYNGSTDDTLEVAAVYVKPGETVEAPETAPARTGYTFSGWYTDAACTQEYNFDTPVTDNLNLYAKWTINTYTVQFHNGYEGIYPDGTDWEAQEIVYLGTVSPVPEPEREGYKFLGWFKADGTQWDFSDYQVTEDTTLYAHWEQLSYQLTYDLHPGSGAVTNAEEFTDGTVYYGDTIQEPENDPILEGYVFQGWYLDASYENEAQFPITVTCDVTLHAKWAEAVTVTFILNDGTDNYYTVQVAKGSAIPEQTNPTLDGYEFVGWFAEDGKWTTTWDFNTIIEEPVTLTAGWETLTGLATFFNKTSTSTYVRIQLTHIDGSVTPANGITDLTLTAKSSDGNTTYFTGVTMTEITEGDDAWQSDWDAGQYAYYYASHPSLAGKSGTLSLTAEGYTFTSISSSSD